MWTVALVVSGPLACTSTASATGLPDLEVVSVTAATPSAQVGTQLAIATKTVNAGSARARPSSTGFFLSLDRRVGASDISLGAGAVPALTPHRGVQRHVQLAIPALSPPGTYFLVACADVQHRVRESHERNNCRTSSAPVGVVLPQTIAPGPDAGSTDGSTGGTSTPTGGTPEPATASLTIDRSSADYGAATTGSSTNSTTFAVTNAGTAASGVLSAALGGTNPGDFKITSDGCTGVTLAAAAGCTVAVGFQPGSSGAKSATLAVSATPGGTVSASLTGSACSSTKTWTVDSSSGSNAYAGSCAAPFKTITKALSVAASGDSIQVEPGSYDIAAGETFPLSVPAGVYIYGDPTSRGTGPVTKVVGDLAIGQNAGISGLWVVGTVTASANGAVVYSSTVNHSGGTCIQTTAGTGVYLGSNTVTGCSHGVLITTSGNATLAGNTITGDAYGVDLQSPATADLSSGGNTLSCSTGADLYTNVSTLNASNNVWDHAPPTTSTSPSGGVDVATSGGNVTTTGATVAVGRCL